MKALLSRRDWVYLLSLLVPMTIYNVALKIASVLSQPADLGLVFTLEMTWSDIFFNLGYALLWIGIFTMVRRGYWRWVVIFLFHAITVLVIIITTCAYQYFRETGTTLDFGIIALWGPRFDEVAPILIQLVSPVLWALFLIILLYVALGPLVVTRAVGRRRRWPRKPAPEKIQLSFLDSLGMCLLAVGFGSMSLLMGISPVAGANTALAREPFLNMMFTGIERAYDGEDVSDANAAGPPAERPSANTNLVPSATIQKRNVVLIHLESTRAQSTTPYNKDMTTTPFLDELAKQSLLVERAYTTVPHTSKASVSVNCGIEPNLVQPVTEANPGGLSTPCLAKLLKSQDYNTVFFQSSVKNFEDFEGLVKNFGYDDYYPLESMDTTGFERTNYFGYEDDIMLKPSEDWLKDHEDKPFLAEYLMNTGHHDYQCLDTRYGSEQYSNDELLNGYLNCLRLQDIFLKNLFDQYKQLGLYDNTIFVLYGDHGEGFAEHGRYQHDDTIWEEGLRVPLIIHAPGLLEGQRVEGLANHTDILPTVLDLLGYDVTDGEYPGYSLLRPLPQDRTLRFSCFHEEQCMASLQGTEKYIYHYRNLPDEIFDLSQDPLEQYNLAGQHSSSEMDQRRDDLLRWRSSVNAAYRGT